jgi:hypothetical protein
VPDIISGTKNPFIDVDTPVRHRAGAKFEEGIPDDKLALEIGPYKRAGAGGNFLRLRIPPREETQQNESTGRKSLQHVAGKERIVIGGR